MSADIPTRNADAIASVADTKTVTPTQPPDLPQGPDYSAYPKRGVQELPVGTNPRAVRSLLAKTLVFTLLGVLAVGAVATTVLAARGVPSDAITTFLHDAMTTLVPLVSAVVGFYFGAETRSSNDTSTDTDA